MTRGCTADFGVLHRCAQPPSALERLLLEPTSPDKHGAPRAPKAAGASLEDHGAAPERAEPAVRWFGTLRSIMHEGRTQSAVKLASVLPGPRSAAP